MGKYGLIEWKSALCVSPSFYSHFTTVWLFTWRWAIWLHRDHITGQKSVWLTFLREKTQISELVINTDQMVFMSAMLCLDIDLSTSPVPHPTTPESAESESIARLGLPLKTDKTKSVHSSVRLRPSCTTNVKCPQPRLNSQHADQEEKKKASQSKPSMWHTRTYITHNEIATTPQNSYTSNVIHRNVCLGKMN